MAQMRFFFLSLIACVSATVTVTILHDISYPQAATITAKILPKPTGAKANVNFFVNTTVLIGTVLAADVVELTNPPAYQAVLKYQVNTGPTTGGFIVDQITAKYKAQTSAAKPLKIYQSRTAVTLQTNKPSYVQGEKITVTGTVVRKRGPQPDFKPTKFIFRNADTNALLPCEIPPGTTNPFTCTFTPPKPNQISPVRILGIYPGDGVKFGGSSQIKNVTRTCKTNQADCNNDFICETNTSSSDLNCGSCGNACDFPHSESHCVSSVCTAPTCDLGFLNCDASTPNGCEFTCDDLSPPTVNTNVSLAYFPSNSPCTDPAPQGSGLFLGALENLAIAAIPRRGSGNQNSKWIQSTLNGIELGLRLEERFVGPYTPLNRLYTTKTGSTTALARWNYGLSVDLRNPTGPFADFKKLGDYNVTLKFEILFDSMTNNKAKFPFTIDVTNFAKGLINDMCSCGTPPSKCGGTCSVSNTGQLPNGFTIDGETIPDPTDCVGIASNFGPKIRFVQESSNIKFSEQIPTFDINEPGLLSATLSISPKVGGCNGPRCSHSVTMLIAIST